MKVYMRPRTQSFNEGNESGIRRVVEAWERYLPDYGIEFVENGTEDISVGHAGLTDRGAVDVLAAAGLYWTSRDTSKLLDWELKANVRVIEAFRYARHVIVPSHWVAMNVARDMRFYPHVIGHGVEWEEWQHDEEPMGYVLWNKNRVGDVCNPAHMYKLALANPGIEFVSTFSPDISRNVHVTGVVPNEQMKLMVQKCSVYLSSTKETFGIGTLEAMAAGKPILGYRHGGNLDLVKHGVNGYLASPGNIQDLSEGLQYCLKYAKVLGDNGREMAKAFKWQEVCQKVAQVFELATQKENEKVSIVIPCYNYGDKVSRAIDSAVAQDYDDKEIIVVDDGSTDDSFSLISEHIKNLNNVQVFKKNNQGVASARNYGIERSTGGLIVCLDADDAIEPNFVSTLVPEFVDPSLGIAYTGLQYVLPDGETGVSEWPQDWDYNHQLSGLNQIPTCCMFRKEMWKRLGGYKDRCCPRGAGFEDADFWLRAGAYGWKAKKATQKPLFIYSWKSGRYSGQPLEAIRADAKVEHQSYETWYPWFTDQLHPFASYAKPLHYSHQVRQYDEPDVSVIIPVGPKHENTVFEALDSLESQKYRNWEGIIVWDSPDITNLQKLKDAYPFIKVLETGGKKGAGYARNRGVEIAKAPLLLYLDADDWLYPEFIQSTILTYLETEYAVYTDYVGKAFINEQSYIDEMDRSNRLLYWDGNEAVIKHKGLDFDCAKAMQQPDDWPFYVWNNITTLFPKAWHNEIGGFDESMESWEDWLYWLMMARKGHCFTCVHEPLMVYRFYTGSRRDIAHTIDEKTGRHKYKTMIRYIKSRLEEMETVGCSGCGNKSTSEVPVRSMYSEQVVREQGGDAFKMCRYYSDNMGDHRVGSPSGAKPEGYGYHSTGDRFMVHIADVRLMPGMFIMEQDMTVPRQAETVAPPEPVNIQTVPARPDAFTDSITQSVKHRGRPPKQ